LRLSLGGNQHRGNPILHAPLDWTKFGVLAAAVQWLVLRDARDAT